MAAEQTAAKVGTFVLSANTQAEINITAPLSVKTVEIVHHGNVADVVYFKTGTTEAEVAIGALAEDDAYVVTQHRRVIVNVPRNKAADTGIWIGLRSNGAVGVTVIQSPAVR